MRRMITEKDVEKLDNTADKLSRIQDPKDATLFYVLTSTTGGKAIFMKPSEGTKITKIAKFNQTAKLKASDESKWGKHTELYYNIHHPFAARLEPTYGLTIDNVEIPLTAATVLISGEYSSGTAVEVCFSDEAVNKYNITTDSVIKLSMVVYGYDE